MNNSPDIQGQLEKCYVIGSKIFSEMEQEIQRNGIRESVLPVEPMMTGKFFMSTDPFTGLDSLTGEWRETDGRKLGEIRFHADGSFYAEYDVLQAHPSDKQWFVESVTAWGRNELVKTEMKLIPALTGSS